MELDKERKEQEQRKEIPQLDYEVEKRLRNVSHILNLSLKHLLTKKLLLTNFTLIKKLQPKKEVKKDNSILPKPIRKIGSSEKLETEENVGFHMKHRRTKKV